MVPSLRLPVLAALATCAAAAGTCVDATVDTCADESTLLQGVRTVRDNVHHETDATELQPSEEGPEQQEIVVDGCSNQNREVHREVRDAGTTASVRCCSMDGTECTTSGLAGGCQRDKTFFEAHMICAGAGMRLCSEADIDSRVCCGTGCGFDGHQVWTAEPVLEEPEDDTPPLQNQEANCWNPCDRTAGRCDFCGTVGVCCRQGFGSDPAECGGLGAPTYHTCILPVAVEVPEEPEPLQNQEANCWHPCDRTAGRCDFCGTEGVCCRQGFDSDPAECGGRGAPNYHTCILPVVVEEPEEPEEPALPLQNEGSNCWNPCERTAGRCAFCGTEGVCCREGFHNDPAECGGRGAPNYHTCILPVVEEPDEEEQCLGIYEAESATIVGGVVHANTASAAHAGFSGDSFVDYLHPNDDYVEWPVPSCSGGSATLSFRYALAGGNRPLQVLVNGEEVTASLSFPATGSWSSWSKASVSVELNAGSNVVRLVAAGSSGANMDALIIKA